MKQIFDSNSRIEKINDGIKFYEQDILSCSYVFEDDLIIDLDIDYIMPGFGIVIIEDNDVSLQKIDIAYLFKIGSNDFTVIEKNFSNQQQLQHTSCVLSPSINNKNIKLKFTYKNNQVSFDWIFDNDTTYNLGKITLKKKIGRYRIGFYSNQNNIIHSFSFKQGIAKNWNASIKNTCGGRISFFDNGFMFENCDYDAEIEQYNIPLKKGIYYLSYDTDKVNDEFNIDCYVIPSDVQYEEKNFEDENKNLLSKDNIINLTTDMVVNLKFKGVNGKIKNISIKEDPDSGYVETEGEVVSIDGSYMTVYLKELKQVRWKGTITTIPKYIDFTKPCPYAVIETINHRTTIEEINVQLKQEYGYVYDVETSILSICDTEYKNIYKQINIELCEEDQQKINVFRNINAFIFELILTKLDGEEINVILQKTFKKYIIAKINGPIIVTKEDKKTVFDLSSSYREFSIENKTLKLYSSQYPISINASSLFVNSSNLKVYAIPDYATVDMTKNTIEECASSFIKLKTKEYTIEYFNENTYINILDELKIKYPNIIIEYSDISDFEYWFTNYEREVFNTDNNNLVLSKKLLEASNNVIIYGILPNSIIKESNLYRVPKGIINSIDYYAEQYNILLGNEYNIDYANNEIRIEQTELKKYKQIIIDYIKNDSYAINYIENLDQYEVDIATNEDMVYVNYNMHDDGSTYSYKTTNIIPDKNKYVVLRKEE